MNNGAVFPGRIAHEEPTLTFPKGHQVKNIKKFAVALAVSAIGFGLVPAGTSFAKGGDSGGGGGSTAPAPTQPSGGGTVAGANGSFGGVRREINWDGVPAGSSAPDRSPSDES